MKLPSCAYRFDHAENSVMGEPAATKCGPAAAHMRHILATVDLLAAACSIRHAEAALEFVHGD
jgi:hypothetical protein